MRHQIVALVVLLLFAGAPAAAQEPLRAGVARVDITPPMEMKAALGGYGDRMSRPAVGVHDRLWAKALWMTDGQVQFALVTVDALCFPPPLQRAVWAKLKELNAAPHGFLILPSHSHNSFDLMALHPDNVFGIPQMGVFHRAAFDHVVAKLVEVIAKSREQLVPVKVGTLQAPLPGWHRNRRSPAGAIDPELTLTRFDRLDGSPLAVLVNWAAHPTILGPKEMLFSGDWPGALQRNLEDLIGAGVTVLYANGAQGDLSPTPRPGGGQTWEQVEAYGRGLALECRRLWERISVEANCPLAFRKEVIALPPRKKHADFMKLGGKEYGMVEQGLELMLQRLFPTESETTCLRLGSLVIVGVPGEMAAELGIEVKKNVRQATGLPHVVIGGLANEWISYILSPAEYRRGGYEATISFYGETLGAVIVEGVVKTAATLAPSPRPTPSH